MNPAYSVILFTTASGAGYGLLALLGLVGINHGQSSSIAFGVTATVLALALITVGLLSSTFHLGHPERAWRALSQWRSSWLSREGVAAVLTYPVALLFGLIWSGIIERPEWIAVLGIACIVMSAVTVFCTGKIYASLKTIPQWHNDLTVPVYLVFALATGSAVLMAVATLFGRFQAFQVIFTAAALIIVAILKSLYWRSIDNAIPRFTMGDATGLKGNVRQWEVPHTNVNFIQKEMGYVVARRHAEKLRNMVMVTLAIAVLASLLAWLVTPWLSFGVAVAALVAAAFERWLFFAEATHVVNLYYGLDKA
ncbi:MAG: dimethyl sulfoxide reductase anchor subunit [Rhizobiales bacterium]|nr:dimethyl sulfoxide reductase anchor subunit [Hyphomicrobiales bacterium]